MSHDIIRTCLGCSEKKQKHELVRIVKNKQGDIFVDISKKQSGRGAYICNNKSCLDKLVKNKRLNKVFKTKIPENIYEKLYEFFENQ